MDSLLLTLSTMQQRILSTRHLLILSFWATMGLAMAEPLVAFTNLPPPGNFKVGGSTLGSYSWKALQFSTPSSNVTLKEIKIGLNCISCTGNREPYPSTADVQISLYSVMTQDGRTKPHAEIYSLPMQTGLILTGRGTTFTYSIPDWQLQANTAYALVLKSTDSNPVKWANIAVASVDTGPQAQNGFAVSASSSYTDKYPGNFSFDQSTGQLTADSTFSNGFSGNYPVTIEMTQPGTSAAPVTTTLNLTVIASGVPSLRIWYPNFSASVGTGPVSIKPSVLASSGTLTYSLDTGATLPNGLSLNSATGEISGTPSTPTGSTFAATILVNNGAGASASASVQMDITPFTSGLPATLVYPANLVAYLGYPLVIAPATANLSGTPVFDVQVPAIPIWISYLDNSASNNAVEMKFLFTPIPAPIPLTSDGAKAFLALLMIGIMGWARQRTLNQPIKQTGAFPEPP